MKMKSYNIGKMKIEDRFLKLRNKLKKLNEEYYNSKPSIDDSNYDDLKNALLKHQLLDSKV